MDKVIKLCNKYNINNIIYDSTIQGNATGIGDILFAFLCIKNNLIPSPFYFNLTWFTKPYYMSDPINQLEFRINLINDLLKYNNLNTTDIVYIVSNKSTNESIPYKIIDTFKLQINNNLPLHNNIEYIIFHTKCRHFATENYDLIKTTLINFCKNFKSNYKIYIMGEQYFPITEETICHKITTVYNELLNLKQNNDIIDITIPNIYNNLDYNNYLKDIQLIQNAKYNICFGLGGQLCSSLIFGNSTIYYTPTDYLNNQYLLNNNIYLCNSLNKFYNTINKYCSITNKFQTDINITSQDIISNNCEIIQTGIGDLLFAGCLLKQGLINSPLYINMNIYENNIYQLNNANNSFDFKLQLLTNIFNSSDIIFFNDKNLIYSNWQKQYANLKETNTLHKYFNLTNLYNKEYIVFHTKCRFDSTFNYKFFKNVLKNFLNCFKTNYQIIILGERIMPDNYETNILKTTTTYNELLELKINNDVLDLSIDNIYDNLNYENYCKDLSIIHNAKANIIIGAGGSVCSSILFGQNTILYILPEYLSILNINTLKNNNIQLCFNTNDFFKKILFNYSNTQFKQRYAFFLSHNGLGDNITNTSAIHYLLNYYETIYFLCKDIYVENVNLLFTNKPVITIPVNSADENNHCKKIINSIPKADLFISGCHTSYLKSRITHPHLLNYIKNNGAYACKYKHITQFYNDNGLDLSIYFEYFNIESSEKSIEYYKQIKQYKIVFLHTKASNREINLDNIVQLYNTDEYIIICANKNVYALGTDKYELANKYINIYVAYYIDIIKNAEIIHVINSCFACIIYPLITMNNISPKECKIYEQ